jgi:competence protein ComEC
LVLAGVLAAGVFIGDAVSGPRTSWLLVLAAGVLLLGGLVLARRTVAPVAGLLAVLAAWFLVGVSSYQLQARLRAPDDVSHLAAYGPRLLQLRGVLAGEPVVKPATPSAPLCRSSATLAVEGYASGDGSWAPVSGRVYLTVAEPLVGLSRGDRVEVKGWLSPLRPAGNPGQYDWSLRRAREGVGAILRPRLAGNIHLIERAGEPLARVLRALRAHLAEVLDAHMGASAPLLRSLLLGEQEMLPTETRQQLIATGTMHFIAISGFHVAVLAGAVWWLLRLVRTSRRWSAVVVVGAVVIYVLLTGLRPGAVRAAVMCAVLCGGVFFARPVNVLNSLGLAALLILLANPAQLFDAGFQLSFVAVLSILAFASPLYRVFTTWFARNQAVLRLTGRGRLWLAFTKVLASLLAVSLSAWTAVVPLLAAYFHIFSPYVVALSVFFSPIFSGLVVVGFLYLLLASLSSTLAFIPGALLAVLAWLLRLLLAGASRLPEVVFYVGAPTLAFTVTYYGLLAVTAWWVRRVTGAPPGSRRAGGPARAAVASGRWLLVAAGLFASVFLLAPVVSPKGRNLQVTVLDVGHGLSVLVRFPGGGTLLYDAGGGSLGYDVGGDVIAPALWAAGVPRIDVLVLSHDHWDHCGGVAGLLPRFPVRLCVVNEFFAGGPAGAAVVARLEQAGVPVSTVSRGDRIVLDPRTTVQVLNPPAGPAARLLSTNEASLALLLEYEGRRMVLLGDVTGPWLAQVLEEAGGPVDCVLIPHHGLGDGLRALVASRARPRYAFVSTPWSEQALATRSMLEAERVTTYLTGEQGALTVVLGEQGVQTSSYLTSSAPVEAEEEPSPLIPEAEGAEVERVGWSSARR